MKHAMILALLFAVVTLGSFSQAASAGGSDGAGTSKFYFDTLKMQALLAEPKLQEPFYRLGVQAGLDAIEQIQINDAAKVISYRVRSGKCFVIADLTWGDGWNPNYRVSSISSLVCE